jgi:hypothetical protein
LIAILMAIGSTLLSGTTAHAARDPGTPSSASQDAFQAAFLVAKKAGKVKRPGFSMTPQASQTPPPSQPIPDCVAPCSFNYLDQSAVRNILEPRGDQRQYGGSYSSSDGLDKYMWKMCGPGATAAALVYWGAPVFGYGPWTINDGHASSYWDHGDGHGRPYILYLAKQSPEFSPAGLLSYSGYLNADTFATRISTALNHEANTTFFVTYLLSRGDYNQTSFHDDIQSDIDGNVAPIVGVNAQYLPNWTQQNGVTGHYIAIVGYDDARNTWTYMDTCGPGCNSPSNQPAGIYTVDQATMWNAETNNNGNGSLIW